MHRRYSYLILAGVILWSCSAGADGPEGRSSAGSNAHTAYSAARTPAYRITLEDSLRFGSTDEHLVGVRGWGNVLADERDRVYIPDYRTNVIHVFDSSGRYLTGMGGTGKGPGMYLHMSAFDITPDHLYLYDRGLFKVAVYSLEDLTHSRTILLNRDDWQDVGNLNERFVGYREFFVSDGGHILMGFHPLSINYPEYWEREEAGENNTVQYYWLNQDGHITSDIVVEQAGAKRVIYEFWMGTRVDTFDFLGEPLFAMSDGGMIATASTREFEITIYDPEGRVETVIAFPFERAPLERRMLIEAYYEIYDHDEAPSLAAYKTIDLPDTWHALEEIFFDDRDRLWVAAVVDEREVYEWFVFDTGGQLQARFLWPRDKPIEEVNGDFVYTAQKDDQGVRYIVRYTMVLEEN